jgi:putative spermidine/putrescine transport system permease protein
VHSAKRKSKSLTKKLMFYLLPFAIGIIFFVWIALPLIMALLWSLVNPEYPWSYPQIFPEHPSFYHWIHVFKYTSIVGSIGNSLFIAVMSMMLSFLLALPTAYALGRRPLKGKEIFKIIMLLPMVFPGMAMALFLGRLLFMAGFSNTYTGVVIAHTLIGLPYMLRILTVSFESMPQELLDAADNLGAGSWTKFIEIYFPMILPGFVAGSIFTFITSMEEFNLSFIIGAPTVQTVPTILYSYLGYNFLRTSASVVALIMVIPNIILLMITEQYIKTEYMGVALGKM